MKVALIPILITSAVSSVFAEEITVPEYGFSATFPTSAGWSAPEHTRSSPHEHVLTWSAKNERRKEMIYVSIIDAPFPDRKPTFRENALEWEKGVREGAAEILLTEFTTLGGRETYQVTGKVVNFGSEYFFVRWMSESGDITYQVSLISEAPPDLKNGAFHEFLESIVIEPKAAQPARSDNGD